MVRIESIKVTFTSHGSIKVDVKCVSEATEAVYESKTEYASVEAYLVGMRKLVADALMSDPTLAFFHARC